MNARYYFKKAGYPICKTELNRYNSKIKAIKYFDGFGHYIFFFLDNRKVISNVMIFKPILAKAMYLQFKELGFYKNKSVTDWKTLPAKGDK